MDTGLELFPVVWEFNSGLQHAIVENLSAMVESIGELVKEKAVFILGEVHVLGHRHLSLPVLSVHG